MPRETYVSPAISTRQITVPRTPILASESAEEIHKYVQEINRATEYLADQQETHVSVW